MRSRNVLVFECNNKDGRAADGSFCFSRGVFPRRVHLIAPLESALGTVRNEKGVVLFYVHSKVALVASPQVTDSVAFCWHSGTPYSFFLHSREGSWYDDVPAALKAGGSGKRGKKPHNMDVQNVRLFVTYWRPAFIFPRIHAQEEIDYPFRLHYGNIGFNFLRDARKAAAGRRQNQQVCSTTHVRAK